MPAPIIKWAGGKRQLLPEIRSRVPEDYGRYLEPFIGGGAVLFDLAPERAVVGDITAGLIELYEVIRDDVDAVIDRLRTHAAQHSEEHFYLVRAWDRQPGFAGRPAVDRAARMLYLNKTCYNGLHRVNRQGQFNVPYGRYVSPNIVNEDGLRAVHDYLSSADVSFNVASFEQTCAAAQPGDFVYLDPPYDTVSDTANFTSYAQDAFGKKEQQRLKEVCDDLDRRGVYFLLSNSATEFIRELYATYRVDIVKAGRAINSNASRRGKVNEVLVRNYA
ncbi:DNA adenine methylase [Corynebacterium sp. TAE3-ERU12]|uniref:DNA adenine methylase n=1 Tax=Corynebacterium sp. TAE3-ERU12 TaxID=2849491 RepID=UPI001C45DF32|nr:DNA adenine methylase [Corynebacterium sp. TAE3-ERU12]